MDAFLRSAWSLFQSLWYWVPVGVLLGELLQAKLPAERIERSIRTHGVRSVAAASVAGAAIPLCACGVIPFLVTFLSLGIPLAPILAFTAASPIMEPADMVLTLGVLGWRFALCTLFAAIALGMGTGLLYTFLRARGLVEDGPRSRAKRPLAQTRERQSLANWLRHLAAQLWFVGKYLLLAIVLGALVESLVPPAFIRAALGVHSWYAIPAGVGIGLLTYGISSVPFAKVLLDMGASTGAVMAFYLAGHATSVGLLTTMAALVRRRTFALYIGTTVAVSLVFGIGFQAVHAWHP